MTKRKTGSNQSETVTKTKEGASKSVPRKQAAARKPTAKSAAGTGKTRAKSTTTAKTRIKSTKIAQNISITIEQRVMMISEAAYYNALNSDSDGQDMRHWLQAEADIDARFHLS